MPFCPQALAFQALPFIARRRAWLCYFEAENAHIQGVCCAFQTQNALPLNKISIFLEPPCSLKKDKRCHWSLKELLIR